MGKGYGRCIYSTSRQVTEVQFELDIPHFKHEESRGFQSNLSESMYNDALKKNLAYLKSFVKWAKEKHYTVCEEFDSYKPKLPKGMGS